MSIIDVSKDPYGRRYYARIKRREFEKIKRTQGFKEWKARQLKVQHHRCAYCRIQLNFKNIVTHVDHIQPLYFEGTSDFSNLVLSCRRCNVKKWIRNDLIEPPTWVKENDKEMRLFKARKQQRAQMMGLVRRELDEQIGFELKQKLQ